VIQRNESDYKEIANSSLFQALLQQKLRFIVPMTIFFFIFYFALPIMTTYFTVLNQPAFGSISWAWVFAFAQFVMTWGLCILYTYKAKKFDKIVAQLKQHGGTQE
jgi:uncharacterized membrane protein (DUF485 family)